MPITRRKQPVHISPCSLIHSAHTWYRPQLNTDIEEANYTILPPLTRMFCPVTQPFPVHNHPIASAISSGSPSRSNGEPLAIAATSESGFPARNSSVPHGPGETQLTCRL
jgi:hypothetical protein